MVSTETLISQSLLKTFVFLFLKDINLYVFSKSIIQSTKSISFVPKHVHKHLYIHICIKQPKKCVQQRRLLILKTMLLFRSKNRVIRIDRFKYLLFYVSSEAITTIYDSSVSLSEHRNNGLKLQIYLPSFVVYGWYWVVTQNRNEQSTPKARDTLFRPIYTDWHSMYIFLCFFF